MSMKEKMMDKMMENMSKEERMEMMNRMMEKFFADLTPEDKQKMMKKMMPKMMGVGMPMMSMMKDMMGGVMDCCGEDFNPMDMCKEMMGSISRSRDIAEFATPELRTLFEDWVQQIEEEILNFVKDKDSVSTEEIASQFELSKDSVIYILGKLAKENKLKFKPEKI